MTGIPILMSLFGELYIIDHHHPMGNQQPGPGQHQGDAATVNSGSSSTGPSSLQGGSHQHQHQHQHQQQQQQPQQHPTIASNFHGQIPPGAYLGGSGGAIPPTGMSYGAYHLSGGSLLGAAGANDTTTSIGQQQQLQQQRQTLGRSSSDASMTIMDTDPTSLQSGYVKSSSVPTIDTLLEDDSVPTVFRWEHGGRQVYITGTFNGWSRQIPMHRSGNDFTYIHNLKRGKHAFKFIVDDEWRFAPDQPTVADIEGRINNFIDVTDFKPYTGDKDFDKEKAAAEYGALPITIPTPDGGELSDGFPVSDSGGGGPSSSLLSSISSGGSIVGSSASKPDRDGEVYGQRMPDVDDYTKEPPPLPPHLRHIILNKPPQLQDTTALPVPQHVALNHLYCTAIKDNMMVLGITQRFKTKFVTTVYYSPCSGK
jgi:5'-AMP-activated protein kinase, regulatory beta subunit